MSPDFSQFHKIWLGRIFGWNYLDRKTIKW